MSAEDIRRELESARTEARRLAAEQQEWRSHVGGLFERALAAGLSVDEIVESLGLGGKWTQHQQERRHRRTLLDKPFFFGAPG